ncbi:hypothetical protein V6N13_032530 [Hibiscus sabdariffa]|uniref:Uncharacterized protein n=1 Tax=Hibiscus sabdariffa TaxID=183260 RepID=A0ABR2NFD7_9ROSI
MNEEGKEVTSDKNKGAIQGNESPDPVKETHEIKLVLDGAVRFVNILKLNHPTRQIYAHPFVLEMVKRQRFLARFQNIPQILNPHFLFPVEEFKNLRKAPVNVIVLIGRVINSPEFRRMVGRTVD